jgi:hypothetical protein
MLLDFERPALLVVSSLLSEPQMVYTTLTEIPRWLIVAGDYQSGSCPIHTVQLMYLRASLSYPPKLCPSSSCIGCPPLLPTSCIESPESGTAEYYLRTSSQSLAG